MAGNVRQARRRRVWLDLLLAGITIWCFGIVVHHAIGKSNSEADQVIVANEARELYEALVLFHDRNGHYPAAEKSGAVDRESLEPLKRRGYYAGNFTSKLMDRRLDAYVSTASESRNQEFWLEMSLAADPSIRFLVSRSDDAPLGGGKWREGAFVFRDGKLRPL